MFSQWILYVQIPVFSPSVMAEISQNSILINNSHAIQILRALPLSQHYSFQCNLCRTEELVVAEFHEEQKTQHISVPGHQYNIIPDFMLTGICIQTRPTFLSIVVVGYSKKAPIILHRCVANTLMARQNTKEY